jgi:hypothetical protein
MNFINSIKVLVIFWNLEFKQNTKHTGSSPSPRDRQVGPLTSQLPRGQKTKSKLLTGQGHVTLAGEHAGE